MTDAVDRIFRVSTGRLNLRDRPNSGRESVVLAELPLGQAIARMDHRDHSGWWYVFVDTPAEGIFLGYVSSRFLVRVDTESDPLVNPGFVSGEDVAGAEPGGVDADEAGPDDTPEDLDATPLPTELRDSDDPLAALSWPEAHAVHRTLMTPNDQWGVYRLNEEGMPTRDAASDKAERVEALRRIAGYLAPEVSRRYARSSAGTKCNIYAHDFATLAGAYLPRVWWTDAAVSQIVAGDKPEAKFSQSNGNVREMSANMLMGWFKDFSQYFGWKRVATVGELQAHANDGGVATIVARNRNPSRSGHIVIIAPEGSSDAAGAKHNAKLDASGSVLCPVISQAGASNYRCGLPNQRAAGNYWWQDESEYVDHGFWIHP